MWHAIIKIIRYELSLALGDKKFFLPGIIWLFICIFSSAAIPSSWQAAEYFPVILVQSFLLSSLITSHIIFAPRLANDRLLDYLLMPLPAASLITARLLVYLIQLLVTIICVFALFMLINQLEAKKLLPYFWQLLAASPAFASCFLLIQLLLQSFTNKSALAAVILLPMLFALMLLIVTPATGIILLAISLIFTPLAIFAASYAISNLL